MKYTQFGALHVGDEFMMVNPAAYPNAVKYRKCSSTEAQHDALRPEPVGSHVVVWPVKIADKRFFSFREIPIGSEFYREVGGDRYQKIDKYTAYNSKTSESIPFGSRVAVLPVVSVKPDSECEAPLAVGKSTDYTINLSEKGYLRLTEVGSLPVTYLGKTIEIGPLGRGELTVGLIVDAWLENMERDCKALEHAFLDELRDESSKSGVTAASMIVWTQVKGDELDKQQRQVRGETHRRIYDMIKDSISGMKA
ncbi:hypothetical protein [Achromobacter phage shaaii_LB5]|nr:hypothetical protein [Achromobacter phage shaaii_LB5]